ncbi:MAG: peptide chain release factor 1 [Endomicrobium sp.]|jgi:peptide chain release factor 1|nr:peptide chain release factor 1 [Endomicrobium sp.]
MILKKLLLLKSKFVKIEKKLSCFSNSTKVEYKELVKQYRYLFPFVKKYEEYSKLLLEIKDTLDLKLNSDSDIREIASIEYDNLLKKKVILEQEIFSLFSCSDNKNATKSVIMEIRAGTGGEEASLFVNDLYKMYISFIEKNKWKFEILNSTPTGIGGYKEIIFEVHGNNVWKNLKFERGVHRVQRVPETETSDRVHTSTVTVAVLLTAKENIDIMIKPDDIRIDTYRASGAGGQHVNKTDSAIRITHLKSGIIVTCQDERSQIKNKTKAFKILMAKLYEKKRLNYENKISNERKLQIGTGDRSEKIRTYNFHQNRVTDHRIGYSEHNINKIMNGDLFELLNKLIKKAIL